MKRNQKIAIAVIIVITFLIGALILITGNTERSVEDAHGEAKQAEVGPKSDGHEEGKGRAEHGSTDEKELHADSNLIRLSDAQIRDVGIQLAKSGPATIAVSVQLPGEIKFNQDRTAHVVPRIAGVVDSVSADLGQHVKKGQLLAVISSITVSDLRSELLNAQDRLALAKKTYQREKQLWEEKISAEQDYLQAQQSLKEAEISARNAQQKLAAMGIAGSKGSLNRYELRAPFDGTIVEKHIALGESVREDANVFTIADLSTVWAEIVVPAHQLNVVRVGEQATVRTTAFDSEATGKVSYVGALIGEQTRTAIARVVLPNRNATWRPGLFTSVDILADRAEVSVAVVTDAIQTIDDKTVVFVRTADGFEPRNVKIGRRDSKYVEILDGLQAGVAYASSGSFVLKAEQGKGSVEDEH
jgi:cobalt-zinc-cadmium efflux system membrane fusion protein